MSEPGGAHDTQPMQGAGAMIRAARQAQGIHIAALATTLKVTPRKLEALEADRYDELQGSTFVRALAQAACRSLKIDPAPVLACLPAIGQHTLDQVSGGLNAPFREHGARRDALDIPVVGQGALWAVAVLMVGAAALWLVPAGWKPTVPSWLQPGALTGAASAVMAETPSASTPEGEATPQTAAEPPATVAAVAAPVNPDSASAPGSTHAAATEAPLRTDAVEPVSLLQVRASAESWVEVIDATGQSLTSRTLHPGEVVDLDGALPLRVKIGNASGTELNFRGQVQDLTTHTRDNIARLELK